MKSRLIDLLVLVIAYIVGNEIERWLDAPKAPLRSTLGAIVHNLGPWGFRLTFVALVLLVILAWRFIAARWRVAKTTELVNAYKAAIEDDNDCFIQTYFISTTTNAFFLEVSPLRFDSQRIAVSDLESIAERLQVSSGGLLVPYQVNPPYTNIGDGDGVQKMIGDGEAHEAFRLHSSGLFTLMRINPYETRNRTNYSAPRVLGFLFLIKTITAMFVLVNRISEILLSKRQDKIQLHIWITGILGRTLVNDAPEIFTFEQGPSCAHPRFDFAATVTKEQIARNPSAIASDCILKILWHFNQSKIERQLIERGQQGSVRLNPPTASVDKAEPNAPKEADLWLCGTSHEPPADNTEPPKIFDIVPMRPVAPLFQHFFVVNRGDKTIEGGGRVELWVPTSLLDNALTHEGDWRDKHSGDTIDGVHYHLFHREFSDPIYGGKAIELPPFRFGRVALGEYTLYYQVVTAARTYPSRNNRMKFLMQFATRDMLNRAAQNQENQTPQTPRSTVDIHGLGLRVKTEFSKVDPNWSNPTGQPISVGFALYGVPGTDKVNYVVSNGGDKQSLYEAALIRALGSHAGEKVR